jgi:hypothetical protein
VVVARAVLHQRAAKPRLLPNPNAGMVQAALDGHSHRGAATNRERLRHVAIRAPNPPGGDANHAHLSLQPRRNLDRDFVGGRDLGEPGLNAVMHDVDDNVGPIVILDFEDDRFRSDGYRVRGRVDQ